MENPASLSYAGTRRRKEKMEEGNYALQNTSVGSRSQLFSTGEKLSYLGSLSVT
jgi:hypothetical protein